MSCLTATRVNAPASRPLAHPPDRFAWIYETPLVFPPMQMDQDCARINRLVGIKTHGQSCQNCGCTASRIAPEDPQAATREARKYWKSLVCWEAQRRPVQTAPSERNRPKPLLRLSCLHNATTWSCRELRGLFCMENMAATCLTTKSTTLAITQRCSLPVTVTWPMRNAHPASEVHVLHISGSESAVFNQERFSLVTIKAPVVPDRELLRLCQLRLLSERCSDTGDRTRGCAICSLMTQRRSVVALARTGRLNSLY